MKIRITTGDWGGDYEADTGKDAIKQFFADIFAGKIKFPQLSPIGNWTDGKDDYPFRIAPALFKAGKITLEELRGTLRQCDLDFSDRDLKRMASADAWMLENTKP